MIKILLIFYLFINFINCTILPNTFNLIGPFPIGEHEEIYDTLENYGGIFNIPIGDNTSYPSELGKNSVVGWSVFNSSIPGALQVDWSNTIDWSFYQMPFGWNINLWYAYAIGDFIATETSNHIVNCTDLRTFYIQSKSNPSEIYEYSGDFFSYGNGQQIVSLKQNEQYRIYFRMVSSTRVYGNSAFSQFTCNLIPVQSDITVITSESLISDVVSGILASPYGSITLLNSGQIDLIDGITIDLLENSTSDQLFNFKSLIDIPNLLSNILVGQRFSIPFEISLKDNSTQLECPLNLDLRIQTNYNNYSYYTSIPFNCTEFNNAYLFTFIDFDSTIQYAMLMSPLNQCSQTNTTKCMIMLGLHGFLGVTRDSSWFGSFNRQPNLFVLLPTGRTNCGYDWASSSRLNIFYAIKSLVQLLPGIPENERINYQTDDTKLLITGHSMGGMGCWNLLVRQGDLAMGGACASGFPKLSMYISYELSPGFSYIDQALKSLLMISIEENNVDIISSNLVGLPLMARYGENDTVVNPYHSRRIVRMVSEQSQNENAVIVSETPNENHWFDGMLSDSYMQTYYNGLVSNYSNYLPSIPKSITISTLNPSGTGPRANIYILQLKTPFKLSKIKLTQVYDDNDQLIWYLDTQNVKRFSITPTPIRKEFPSILIIDNGKPINFTNQLFYPNVHFENKIKNKNSNQKNWIINSDSTWENVEKNPSTYGPIRQIFESSIKIIYGTTSNNNNTINQQKQAAIYINNFWNTFGRGSTSILSDTQYLEQLSIQDTQCNENLILIGNSNENILTDKLNYKSDVQFNQDNSFTIGGKDAYLFSDPGTGLAYLMPNQCGNHLVLVISGTDSIGLNNAIHTIPQRSGDITGLDFIVTGSNYLGKGYGGIISAGFWDNNFKLDHSNFYLSEIIN